MGPWPRFDSPFLAEIATTLHKRRKSLKYSVRYYRCERVRERLDGEDFEKLEFEFKWSRRTASVFRASFWDDRWAWLDVRRPSKIGWQFKWQIEGRVGNAGPRAVSHAILQTVRYPFGDDPTAARTFLDDGWRGVVLRGPREVIDQ